MLILRFIHDEDLLLMDDKHFKATCRVRNEINGWRLKDQVIKTFPLNGSRMPYEPRKFPTGVWELKHPIYTNDPEYAPVKIPTTAVRNVFTWSEIGGEYNEISGVQQDSYYHLHYCAGSSTTLGCIRLDSAKDASKIAGTVKAFLDSGEKAYIEVLCTRLS